jgi:hypothetical protein
VDTHFLCSFRPLYPKRNGSSAINLGGLPPFIDGSCRREPDFQSIAPSISALCRSTKFAPRLQAGCMVAYISNRIQFEGDCGWALVALLRVIRRFESHETAAAWYREQGYPVPSNCMVPGNPPQPYHFTNRKPPAIVAKRVGATDADPGRAIRLWDAIYAQRARNCGVFLACEAFFLKLWHPPILRRADLIDIFGRVRGTQNPPQITQDQFRALENFAR